MSGSPKYQSIRLSAAQERTIREQRRHAAKAAAAAREAAAAVRRAAKLADAQNQVYADAERMLRRITGCRRTEIAAILQHLRAEVSAARTVADGAGWEGQAWPCRDAIRSVGHRLDQAIAEAEERERSERAAAQTRAEAERILIRAQSVLRESERWSLGRDAGHDQRRDAAGQAAVRRRLEILRCALSAQDAATAASESAALRDDLRRHSTVVEAADRVVATQRAELEAEVSERRERGAALRQDPAIGRWITGALDLQNAEVDAMVAAIAAERFAEVRRRLAAFDGALEAATAEAAAAQAREDQRQHVIASLFGAFADAGFAVAGGVRLEDPADPRSAALFQASRPTGEAIAVSVPQDLRERVWYDIAGLPRREHLATDGQMATSCDEAETEIERMRTVLAAHGVEAGDLLWEGKDPERIARTALELPSEAQRQAGGAS